MTTPTLHETFHAPGISAELTWRGWRCLLDIRVEASSELAGSELSCELLLQPLDERRLPAGPLTALTTERVRLRRAADRQCWLGRLWLAPEIGFPLARNCYYRLATV
jgi:hypothetical protein